MFQIGDYVKHKEYPKSKVMLHITSKMQKEVVNAQVDDFEHASEGEIEEYHTGDD